MRYQVFVAASLAVLSLTFPSCRLLGAEPRISIILPCMHIHMLPYDAGTPKLAAIGETNPDQRGNSVARCDVNPFVLQHILMQAFESIMGLVIAA